MEMRQSNNFGVKLREIYSLCALIRALYGQKIPNFYCIL